MSSLETRTASPSEVRNVLRLTLATRGQSAGDVERQVTAFIEYARAMSLDLGRQWLSTVDGHAVAACTCIESPGRTAMLFLIDGDSVEADAKTITELVLHVIGQESGRDVGLLQCLIRPDDAINHRVLNGIGFRAIATLLYMERRAPRALGEGPMPRPTVPPGLEGVAWEWITYDDTRHDQFARLILATYQDSLDCPGLCGLRAIDDVIAGHRAAGRFRPHRWLLLSREGQAAGCILFGEDPLRPSLELAYMGVHPDCRGQGLGRFLLVHGLHLAQRERFPTVTLAVDAANAPAMRLYQSTGFRETARRRALVRTLKSTSGRP
ncbi:MAG: GNAT family N-acetyltransferase [Phycisphaerae bacterium]|nr:GNAT family N-acetyltransferase [Phycisphaerae bacterium]